LNIHRKPKSLWKIAIPIGICLMLAISWPASYFWSEGFRIIRGYHCIEITTGPGWIVLTNRQFNIEKSFSFQNYFLTIDAAHRSALSYTRIYSLPGDQRFYFPLWMFSLSMGLLAGGLVISHIRQQLNYKPGLCEKCGYDLRATPDRCPECGSSIRSVP
jgi:hypothetical protein